MNPQGIPLYEGLYGEHPAQPGGPAAVQTVQTVTVITDPPKDHIIWSLLCLVYTNPCCLGLLALIYSFKSRDQKMAGDLEGARHYGYIARRFNIVATALFCLGILIGLISISSNSAATSTTAINMRGSDNTFWGRPVNP